MIKELTDNQKKFCDLFLELGNQTEAYIKAGYNVKGARANSSRLITNDNVQAYLQARRKEMEDERIAKPEEVLKYLTSVMRGEIKDQFDLDAPLQERTKAAEALAKRYRLYDGKDIKSLSELEKEKELLEIERQKLINKKLEIEINKLTGEDIDIEDTDELEGEIYGDN